MEQGKLLRSPRRDSHLTLLEFDRVVCPFQSNYGDSDVILTLFCIGSSLRPAFSTFCTSENAMTRISLILCLWVVRHGSFSPFQNQALRVAL